MEKSHNIKSHLWLQESGEFPSTEAILHEKKLEMSFCCKMKMRLSPTWLFGLSVGGWAGLPQGPVSQHPSGGGGHGPCCENEVLAQRGMTQQPLACV